MPDDAKIAELKRRKAAAEANGDEKDAKALGKELEKAQKED